MLMYSRQEAHAYKKHTQERLSDTQADSRSAAPEPGFSELVTMELLSVRPASEPNELASSTPEWSLRCASPPRAPAPPPL